MIVVCISRTVEPCRDCLLLPGLSFEETRWGGNPSESLAVDALADRDIAELVRNQEGLKLSGGMGIATAL